MPESQHIEYKKSFGKDTIISLESFANTNGGKVIVGVDDNSNHILNLDEIIDLQQQSLSQSYDAYPQKQLVSELQLGLIDQFVSRVNDRGRFKLYDDVLTNLVKLQFVREGRPTLAAILLFGNHGNSIHKNF